MHVNTQRRQRGLSLVEVFVALLVLSVGLIALAKLQVDLVRGSSDARTRTVALALAEEKVEDLRTFAVTAGAGAWTVTANPMAWSYVTGPALATPADTSCTPACAGGRLPPQATYSSALEVAGVRFKRTWEVANRNFTGTGPITSQTKDVRVTIAWQNEMGVEQQVNVLANLVDIPPGNVALASAPVSARPDGPQIAYTPGLAPEVIGVPIDTGTGKRETTKPLPDVRTPSDYAHEVTFDVVNYHLEGSQNVVDRREEFVTVNCRCALAGPGRGRTPARVAFTGAALRDSPGKVIASKPQTGVVLLTGGSGIPSQPILCNICCRDHHDGPAETVGSTTDNNRYKPTGTTDHLHYLRNASTGAYTEATSTGDAYDEACRLKRVNGVFQVFEDWKLASILTMPESDLTVTSIQDAYTAFVQNYVKNSANSSLPGGTIPTFSTTTLVPADATQLSARAIYIDRMPENLVAFLNTDPPPGNFLSYVPFYEINLTKLADWKLQTISTDTDYATVNGQLCDPRTVTQTDLAGKIACIANQAVEDETVLSLGLLQAYWRGTITAGPVSGHLDAQAYARTGNSGLTATFPLSLAESLATPVSSEYRFTVDAGQAISGTINKGSASGNPWSAVSVTASGACSLSPKTGNPPEKTFSCTVPTGWTGTVTAAWTGHTVSATNNVFPPSTLPSSGVVSFVLIP